MQPYPKGIDFVWLASDRIGNVGAFITAGAAPIPSEILSSALVPIESIEGRLCHLPLVAEAELQVSVKRPDDFIDLAQRGIFVYDWTDINRTARDALSYYERVAVPSKAIFAGSLPLDLAALANGVRLADLVFSANQAVDARAHFQCVEP